MNGLGTLTTQKLGRRHVHFSSIDSTNTYLKEQAATLPDGAIATASLQTAGKGRRDKQWNNQRDQGLALSVLLHDWMPGEMALLPLLTGLCVCEAVEALCAVECTLKWSNDVLLDKKKVCGILCESRLIGDRGFAVLGIGVNLYYTKEDLTRLGLVYAQSLLCVTEKVPEALELAAAILNRLEPMLARCRVEGFAPFFAEYKRRCVTLGKPVRVLWEGGQREGVALDLAEDGALLCRIDGVVRTIYAGEASVRGLYDYA